MRRQTANPKVTEDSDFKLNRGMAPKYLRYNIWDPSSDFTPCTAMWTVTAKPLSRPPPSEFENVAAVTTIQENPDLFKIVTPVQVQKFESYLSGHPNRPFVESVCQGLREGFWPWASTTQPGYPDINDESVTGPVEAGKAKFLQSQKTVELAKNRFSPSFGKDLLPGMYCMPIFAVPKPSSSVFRLVTDQSRGKYSLNSMVDHNCVTGYPLDNMTLFGEMLLDLEKREPGRERLAWKSDIAEAYRILPMHPLWQIKQINTIDGNRHVDRCNAFGGCASGSLFIAFNSLVAWIAKEVKNIRYLGNYVDDSSGCGLAEDISFYAPYNEYFPRDQVTLLSLWDELGIPHKKEKQIFGSPLTVIGISVDANLMTLELPEEARERLIDEVKWWGQKGKKEKVKRWYQMGGWFSWGLNVYPLLRPALNNFYPKLKGRRDSTSQIWINNSIRDDFKWALQILESSSGVRLLKSVAWSLPEATSTIFCDACPKGMGFWYPELGVGFVSPSPQYENPDLIFYFEALCVLSALYDAHTRTIPQHSRFVIYTDNLNTVDIFNTFRALPTYNHILKAAVNILLDGGHDLRVLHIPGTENSVADALSRSNLSIALEAVPGLKISPFHPWSWLQNTDGSTTFQPPQSSLGVEEL
jgi:hypothetical protein